MSSVSREVALHLCSCLFSGNSQESEDAYSQDDQSEKILGLLSELTVRVNFEGLE